LTCFVIIWVAGFWLLSPESSQCHWILTIGYRNSGIFGGRSGYQQTPMPSRFRILTNLRAIMNNLNLENGLQFLKP